MARVRNKLVAAGTHQAGQLYISRKAFRWLCSRILSTCRKKISRRYVVVAAEIPDEVKVIEEKALIRRFPGLDTAKLGDHWIESGASAVLRVRSAVVSVEHNYLLNPAHPEFRQVLIAETMPFLFDERLFPPRG